MTQSYLNFDLVIERQAGTYRARVLDAAWGEAEATFAAPFSPEEFEALADRIDRSRARMRRVTTPQLSLAKEMGSRLFKAVLAPEIRASLSRALDEADRQGAQGVRIRLHLDAVPDLAVLPWEFAFDSDPRVSRFVALAQETPLVRYLSLPDPVRPLVVSLPLRVLVVVSNPLDDRFPELDVEREWRLIDKTLDEQRAQGRIEITRLPRATLSALQDELEDKDYHVLHFIGHGRFDQANQDGLLALEGERGGAREVSAEAFGTLLHNEKTLRLVVLNACEGGRASATDPYAGMAQTLVRMGVPAVVAMQFEISDDAAIMFGRQFYRCVALGDPVDAALTNARMAIFQLVSELEWATPVLYMRSPDGLIFDIRGQPAVAPTKPAPVEVEPASVPEPVPLRVEPTLVVAVPLRVEPEPVPAEPVGVQAPSPPAANTAVLPSAQATVSGPTPAPPPVLKPTPGVSRFPRRAVIAGIAFVLVALFVTQGPRPPAPAPTKSPAPTAFSSAPGAISGEGDIVIATDFPVSGADRPSGRPAEAGAQFAVQQAGSIRSYKISVKSYDDAVNGVHDPQRGAQNFTDMVANSKILGVIGPLHSNVSRAAIPIANRASLVMINPSNTDECATQELTYCDPKPSALRPTGKNNYFRISPTDELQGPAMADFAIDVLRLTRIAVWSDNETFGKMTANAFCTRLVARGGLCVARADFNWRTTTDFGSFIRQAASVKAEAVYGGADTATKGCVFRAQMRGAFPVQTPYLGSDGIADAQCIKDAADMGSNIYSTNLLGAADRDSANKQLIDDFSRSYTSKEDFGAYTLMGYDCARILIDAIGRAIDAAGGKIPTRDQVLRSVQDTKLKLATGTYSFNKNGDAEAPVLSVYVSDAKTFAWTFVRQAAFIR